MKTIKIAILAMMGMSLGVNAQDNKIESTGDVGIGTTNPSAKLDVNGRLRMRGGIDFGNDANGYGSEGMISWSSANAFIVKSRQNKALHLGANNINSHLSINTNGNVGIGTIKPGSWKLAVNGQIRAKEVKVETGWSDFVFYDNYNLPTLKEVEKYIKEKGHLKDIPSAKEVEKNGIYLGEMDAKLLQKIEELTLYTIEQEKKIKSLEKQNSKIDKQQRDIEKLKTLVKQLLKDKN